MKILRVTAITFLSISTFLSFSVFAEDLKMEEDANMQIKQPVDISKKVDMVTTKSSSLKNPEKLPSKKGFLSLESAISKGVYNSNSLSAAKYSELAARNAANAAAGVLFPQISYQISQTNFDFSRYEGGLSRDSNNQIVGEAAKEGYDQSGIFINQVLFASGRNFFNIASANEAANAQASAYLSFYNQLILDITASYVDVIYTAGVYLVAKNKEALNQNYLEIANVRYKTGLIGLVDLYTIKANLDTSIAESITAQEQNLIAQQKLNYFLLDDTAKYSMQSMDSMVKASDREKMLEIEKLVAEVMMNNYQLKEAKSMVKSAEYATNAQISKMGPSVNLTAGIYDETRTGRNIQPELEGRSVSAKSVAVNVNVPIFTGGTNFHNAKQYKYQEMQAQESYINLVRSLRLAVGEQVSRILSLRSTIIANEERVKSNRLALEATEKKVFAGRESSVSLLEVQRIYFEAELALLSVKAQLVYEVYKLENLKGSLDKVLGPKNTLNLPADMREAATGKATMEAPSNQ